MANELAETMNKGQKKQRHENALQKIFKFYQVVRVFPQ